MKAQPHGSGMQPQLQLRLHSAGVVQEQVWVQVAQVHRGEGTQATQDRCDRRARSGFRRIHERRPLRELAAPAAAAADGAAAPRMLSRGSDGDGRAPPCTRPRPGRAGPAGQRRRVAVVRPPAPKSSVPGPTERAGGYAADRSSTVSAAEASSDLFDPHSE